MAESKAVKKVSVLVLGNDAKLYVVTPSSFGLSDGEFGTKSAKQLKEVVLDSGMANFEDIDTVAVFVSKLEVERFVAKLTKAAEKLQ